MRTTLARQQRRAFELDYHPMFVKPVTGLVTQDYIAQNWRAAHPRKPKQQPAKQHRRSKNRVSSKNRR